MLKICLRCYRRSDEIFCHFFYKRLICEKLTPINKYDVNHFTSLVRKSSTIIVFGAQMSVFNTTQIEVPSMT
jgi:hypothetical protein